MKVSIYDSFHNIPVLMRHHLVEKLRDHADLSWRDAESLGDVFWQFLLSECTDVSKTYEITKKKDDGTDVTFSAPYGEHGLVHDRYGNLPEYSLSIRTQLTLPADPLFNSSEEVNAFRAKYGMSPLKPCKVDDHNE